LHDTHPEVALYSGSVFVRVAWGKCERLDKVYVGSTTDWVVREGVQGVPYQLTKTLTALC